MKKLVWIILAVILIGLVLIIASNNKEIPPVQNRINQTLPENNSNNAINNSTQIPPIQNENSRSFYMGFVAIPEQPVTTQAWLDAFELLKDNADFVLIHSAVDWEKFVDSSQTERTAASTPNLETVNFLGLMSRQKNLKLFIVLDPLRTDNRDEIDTKLPSEVGVDFGDEKVRNAFKNYAIRIAKDYKPEYLGLGSEINTYMNKNPQDADNLVLLIEETIPLIREESPSTKITSTFQYEGLIGKIEDAQWSLFEKVEPKIDLISITTYPSPWFNTPNEIPIEYYGQIKEHTNKPIIIAESGWPTGGESSFHGSEENQKEFVKKFPQLIKEIDVKLWIWWFLHDWQGEGYPDFFKTMGLSTSDGNEKTSWNSWQDIHSLTKE